MLLIGNTKKYKLGKLEETLMGLLQKESFVNAVF
jgi:hypothetical protein